MKNALAIAAAISIETRAIDIDAIANMMTLGLWFFLAVLVLIGIVAMLWDRRK